MNGDHTSYMLAGLDFVDIVHISLICGFIAIKFHGASPKSDALV